MTRTTPGAERANTCSAVIVAVIVTAAGDAGAPARDDSGAAQTATPSAHASAFAASFDRRENGNPCPPDTAVALIALCIGSNAPPVSSRDDYRTHRRVCRVRIWRRARASLTLC